MTNEKPRYEVNETVLITKTNEKAVVREIIIDKEHNFYAVRLAVFKPHGYDEVVLKLNEIEKVNRPKPKDWFEDEDVVYFAKVHPDAILPTKRDEDAGWDIHARFDDVEITIPPHEVRLVPTGIASACSSKYYLNFKHERGSTATKGMMLGAGVVDSGFRNEIQLVMYNPTDIPIAITKEVDKVEATEDYVLYPYAKAIAQCTIDLVSNVRVKEIPYSKLEKIPSQRGKGMLGSSNK